MWWTEDNIVYQRIDIDHLGNCNEFDDFYACYETDARYGSGPDTIAFNLRDDATYYFAVLNYYAGYPGVPSLENRNPLPLVKVYIPPHEVLHKIILLLEGEKPC